MEKRKVEESLSDVALKQLTWKPDVCRNVALKIAEHSMRDRIFYPDEVDFSFVPVQDVNCIGTAFMRLRLAGMIEQTGRFRKADIKKRPDRKGGMVFQWRLVSYKRAETFCKRNDFVPNITNGQMLLV